MSDQGDYSKKSKQGHTIIAREGDDALLFRSSMPEAPYVVASGYDDATGTWSQGRYLSDLTDAMRVLNHAEEPADDKAGWLELLDRIAEYNHLQEENDLGEHLAACEIVGDVQDILCRIAERDGWIEEAHEALGITQEPEPFTVTIESVFGSYVKEHWKDDDRNLEALNTLAKMVGLDPQLAERVSRAIEESGWDELSIPRYMDCIAQFDAGIYEGTPDADAAKNMLEDPMRFTYEELRDEVNTQWELTRLDEPLEIYDRLPEDREPVRSTIPIPDQSVQAKRAASIDGDAKVADAAAKASASHERASGKREVAR